MGKKKLKELKKEWKRINIPNKLHFVHQRDVSGVGAHKDKSKVIPRKKKHKEKLDEK